MSSSTTIVNVSSNPIAAPVAGVLDMNLVETKKAQLAAAREKLAQVETSTAKYLKKKESEKQAAGDEIAALHAELVTMGRLARAKQDKQAQEEALEAERKVFEAKHAADRQAADDARAKALAELDAKAAAAAAAIDKAIKVKTELVEAAAAVTANTSSSSSSSSSSSVPSLLENVYFQMPKPFGPVPETFVGTFVELPVIVARNAFNAKLNPFLEVRKENLWQLQKYYESVQPADEPIGWIAGMMLNAMRFYCFDNDKANWSVLLTECHDHPTLREAVKEASKLSDVKMIGFYSRNAVVKAAFQDSTCDHLQIAFTYMFPERSMNATDETAHKKHMIDGCATLNPRAEMKALDKKYIKASAMEDDDEEEEIDPEENRIQNEALFRKQLAMEDKEHVASAAKALARRNEGISTLNGLKWELEPAAGAMEDIGDDDEEEDKKDAARDADELKVHYSKLTGKEVIDIENFDLEDVVPTHAVSSSSSSSVTVVKQETVVVQPKAVAAVAAPVFVVAVAPPVVIPSDGVLITRVREILNTADWDKMSAKLLRTQLEAEYKCDLTTRKELINSVINVPPPTETKEQILSRCAAAKAKAEKEKTQKKVRVAAEQEKKKEAKRAKARADRLKIREAVVAAANLLLPALEKISEIKASSVVSNDTKKRPNSSVVSSVAVPEGPALKKVKTESVVRPPVPLFSAASASGSSISNPMVI